MGEKYKEGTLKEGIHVINKVVLATTYKIEGEKIFFYHLLKKTILRSKWISIHVLIIRKS